jgi:hypothetical protein
MGSYIRARRALVAGSLCLSACASGQEIPPFLSGPVGGGAGVSGDGGPIGTAGGGQPNAGGAGNGGSVPNGGATATGGGSPAGGGAAGMSGSGGAPGPGGSGTSGGSNGGAGAAPPCPDTDGDGATDCDEDGDGDDWTDKAVFNGLHVGRANQCSGSGNCGENDTFAEVQACMQNIDEELDQYSGWDWDDAPNDIDSSEYHFEPNWTGSDGSWAAQWEGCIHLSTAGPHCFQIEGGTDEACAAFYFDGNTGSADFQSDTGPKCFTVPEGNYPIFFHYTMDSGSSSGMHVQYCDAAGSASCTPSVAIPAKMLRAQCP